MPFFVSYDAVKTPSSVKSLNSVAASVSELTCQFKNNSVKGSFIIALTNLDKPQVAEQALIYSDYEGEQTAMSFDDTEDMEWYYDLLMSGDGGYKFDDKGNYIQYLDSDCCDVGVLKLYANSDRYLDRVE